MNLKKEEIKKICWNFNRINKIYASYKGPHPQISITWKLTYNFDSTIPIKIPISGYMMSK